jgi:hypothetical protein
MAAQRLDRPAFYARDGGGLGSDLLTLLHPPYTAWHLSYVALGAAAAPRIHGDRVAAALVAFFLAVGIGAHAFDELHDRPLRTRLSSRTLALMGALALSSATAIGVAGVVTVSITLAPFVLSGAAICLAYNLESFGGRFHGDVWFALSWGAFPALTGYWANAPGFTLAGGFVAAACFGLSVAQRRLSTPARLLRRRTASVSGEQRMADGTSNELSRSVLLAPLDGALSAMSVAITLLAAGLLAARLS